MEVLAQEQVRAGLYRIFNRQYFENSNKKRLCDLNKKELSSFYHEQSRFVETELTNFKSTLEMITKHCSKDIADKVCRILITSSVNKMKKTDEETIRHKSFYISLCEKYRLKYLADKLRKIK